MQGGGGSYNSKYTLVNTDIIDHIPIISTSSHYSVEDMHPEVGLQEHPWSCEARRARHRVAPHHKGFLPTLSIVCVV